MMDSFGVYSADFIWIFRVNILLLLGQLDSSSAFLIQLKTKSKQSATPSLALFRYLDGAVSVNRQLLKKREKRETKLTLFFSFLAVLALLIKLVIPFVGKLLLADMLDKVDTK